MKRLLLTSAIALFASNQASAAVTNFAVQLTSTISTTVTTSGGSGGSNTGNNIVFFEEMTTGNCSTFGSTDETDNEINLNVTTLASKVKATLTSNHAGDTTFKLRHPGNSDVDNPRGALTTHHMNYILKVGAISQTGGGTAPSILTGGGGKVLNDPLVPGNFVNMKRGSNPTFTQKFIADIHPYGSSAAVGYGSYCDMIAGIDDGASGLFNVITLTIVAI